MIMLQSALEGREFDFIHSRNELAPLQFVLGGNWEYDHGSFDRFLDERRMVWLRLPFRMTQGTLDSEVRDTEARLRFDQPYVLKHVYEDGLDEDARLRTYAAMVDQFQSPAVPDADIEPHWLEQAREVLRQVEQTLK